MFTIYLLMRFSLERPPDIVRRLRSTHFVAGRAALFGQLALPFAFRQRVSSPGTGLKGDARRNRPLSCPGIVCAQDGAPYAENFGLGSGIFVQTGHTMRWETKNKGGAVMAEEARVFFLRKRRERAGGYRAAGAVGGGWDRPAASCPGLCGFNAAKDPGSDRVLCL